MDIKKTYKLHLYKPSGEYMGELDAYNVHLSLNLEDYSSLTFDIPSHVDGKENERILDIYDSYEVVIELEGVEPSRSKHRFEITETPAAMSQEGVYTYSYVALSVDSKLDKRFKSNWQGILRNDYFRKVFYKQAGDDFTFKDSIAAGILPQGVNPEDIEIYEVRESEGHIKSGALIYIEEKQDSNGTRSPYWQRGAFTVESGNIIIFGLEEGEDSEVSKNTSIYYKIYDNPTRKELLVEYDQIAEDFVLEEGRENAIETGIVKNIDGVDYFEEEYYSKIGLTVEELLETLDLEETGWVFAAQNLPEDLRRSNFEVNNISVKQILDEISAAYGIVYLVDTYNRKVTFYESYEKIENIIQNNLVLDSGAYLKAIEKEISTMNLITNIQGIGANGISFSLASPTGNSWEDYEYYLDDYFAIPSTTNIDDVSIPLEQVNYRQDFNTSDHLSRWLRPTTARKLGLWQLARDYIYEVMKGGEEFYIKNGDQKYVNIFEKREEFIKKLTKNESKYTEILTNELHYRNLAEITEKSKTFTEDELNANGPEVQEYKKNIANYKKQEAFYKNQAEEYYENNIKSLEDDLYNEEKSGTIAHTMKEVRTRLSKQNAAANWNMTNEELKEVNNLRRDFVLQDDTIVNEKDLLDASVKHIRENNKPMVTLTTDIVDILAAQEAAVDHPNLFLGNYIYVRFEDFNIDEKAQIKSLDFNFDSNDIQIQISTVERYTKGLLHKMVKNIRGLLVDSRNIDKINKDRNKKAADAAQKLVKQLGGGFDLENSEITAGADGEIILSGDGFSTVKVDIDHETESFVIERDKSTEMKISDGSISLTGESYTDGTHSEVMRTRVMMSTLDGFRVDVLGEDSNSFKYYDKRFHADLRGNIFVKGNIETNDGTVGGWRISAEKGLSAGSSGGEVIIKPPKNNGDDVILVGGDSWSDANFAVDSLGRVKMAVDGGEVTDLIEWNPSADSEHLVIQGKVTAHSGKIAEWNIVDGALESQSNINDPSTYVGIRSVKRYGAGVEDKDKFAFIAGGVNSQAPFWVNYLGEIKSNNGSIGGWKIGPQGLSKDTVSISSEGDYAIRIKNDSNEDVFKVTHKGDMTSNLGHIGGWVISGDKLYHESGATESLKYVGLFGGSQEEAILVGGKTWASSLFGVKKDGELRITTGFSEVNANELITDNGILKFDGHLNTKSGTIASWEIGEDKLHAGLDSTFVGLITNNQSQGNFRGGLAVGRETHYNNQDKNENTTSGIFLGTGQVGAESKNILSMKGGGADEFLWDGNKLLIKGEIRADKGDIGGWIIEGNSLISKSGEESRIGLDSGSQYLDSNGNLQYSPQAIWAGATNPLDAPFWVTRSGTIKATKGHVGGWEIGTDRLEGKVNNEVRVGLYAYGYDGNDGSKDEEGNPRRIAIAAGGNNWGDAKFAVDYEGRMKATNAYVEGEVEAKSGHIGGWVIDEGNIHSTSSGNNRVGLNSLDEWKIHAGSDDPSSAPFRVNQDGRLVSKKAELGWFKFLKRQDISMSKGGLVVDDDLGGAFGIIGHRIEGSDTDYMYLIDLTGIYAASFPTGKGYGSSTRKTRIQDNEIFFQDGARTLYVEATKLEAEGGLSIISQNGNLNLRTSGASASVRIPTFMGDSLFSSREISLNNYEINTKSSSKTNISGSQVQISVAAAGDFVAERRNNQGVWQTVSTGGSNISSSLIKSNIEKIDEFKINEFLSKVEVKKYRNNYMSKEELFFVIEDEIEKGLPFSEILFKREKVGSMQEIPEYMYHQVTEEDFPNTEVDGPMEFTPLTYDEKTLMGIMIASLKQLHNRVQELESKLNN